MFVCTTSFWPRLDIKWWISRHGPVDYEDVSYKKLATRYRFPNFHSHVKQPKNKVVENVDSEFKIINETDKIKTNQTEEVIIVKEDGFSHIKIIIVICSVFGCLSIFICIMMYVHKKKNVKDIGIENWSNCETVSTNPSKAPSLYPMSISNDNLDKTESEEFASTKV